MVDLLASERHFLDHLAPIWIGLPEQVRGTAFVPIRMEAHAKLRGIRPTTFATLHQAEAMLVGRSGPVLVAAYRDLAAAHRIGRQIVLCEHGAGQSYSNRHTSYAGGAGRAGVVLMLVPGSHPLRRNREAYPQIPCVAVGCPKLDGWHARPPRPRPDPPTVVLSFHWDCHVVPETRSAWPHYQLVLGKLACDPRFRVLGHGHPRILEALRPHYRRAGIEVVDDFAEVLERADLYAVDNSSSLFEFASTGRPVVVLNSPLYRRHVRHGLRFWECADVGEQVERPAQLADAIVRALEDTPAQRARRERAVRAVYEVVDGSATARAVQAILEVTQQMPEPKPEQQGPRGGVRMRVRTTYSGDEGYVRTREIVYTGYRWDEVRKEWRRLPHVNPEFRARHLESRKLAVREAESAPPSPPESAGLPGGLPAHPAPELEVAIAEQEATKVEGPSADKRERPSETKSVAPLVESDPPEDLPTTVTIRHQCTFTGCSRSFPTAAGLRAHVARGHGDASGAAEPAES